MDEEVIDLKPKEERLLDRLKDLKYESMSTILRGHQEGIDWTHIECHPQPLSLWNDIKIGRYIDP